MAEKQGEDLQKKLVYMLQAYDNVTTELISPGNLGGVDLSYALIDGEIRMYAFINREWQDRGRITTQDAVRSLLAIQSEFCKKLKDIGAGLRPILIELISDSAE